MMEIVKKDRKHAGIFGKIDTMVQTEIENDTAQHGDFKSMHDGISTLLEEIEEVEKVMKEIKKNYGEAWESVKNDEYNEQLPIVSKLYHRGYYLVMEGVQMVARAEKYYKYLQEHNPQASLLLDSQAVNSLKN